MYQCSRSATFWVRIRIRIRSTGLRIRSLLSTSKPLKTPKNKFFLKLLLLITYQYRRYIYIILRLYSILEFLLS